MNSTQIILLLSIMVIFLLLIDAFRRNKRKKYLANMSELQSLQDLESCQPVKNSDGATAGANECDNVKIIHLEEDVKVDPFSHEKVSKLSPSMGTFTALDKGYAVLYILAPRGYEFNMCDIYKLFNRLHFNYNDSECCFQSVTEDGDVFYNVLPNVDNCLGSSEISEDNNSSTTLLTCVLNMNRLAKLYSLADCLDHFIKSVSSLNSSLGGILLNEHKRRFTANDENSYKNQVKLLPL